MNERELSHLWIEQAPDLALMKSPGRTSSGRSAASWLPISGGGCHSPTNLPSNYARRKEDRDRGQVFCLPSSSLQSARMYG